MDAKDKAEWLAHIAKSSERAKDVIRMWLAAARLKKKLTDDAKKQAKKIEKKEKAQEFEENQKAAFSEIFNRHKNQEDLRVEGLANKRANELFGVGRAKQFISQLK